MKRSEIRLIVPTSNLIILEGVPFDNSYNDLLTFTNINVQYSYFANLAKYPVSNDFTYIRHGERTPIRIDISADNLYSCNYIMYQNASYGSKWFYAFITSVEYVADGTSYIYFEEDKFQSWQFQFEYKKCFVEREHVTNDTIGANTVPENVELGEYMVTATSLPTSGFIPHLYVAVTEQLETPSGFAYITPTMRGGVIQGFYYIDGGVIVLKTQGEISTILNSIFLQYSQAGKIDAIGGVFIASPVDDKYSQPQTINTPDNVYSGYTPINNKLYTFPYCFMQVDSMGGAMNFRYERMDSNFAINMGYTFEMLPTVTVYPINYNGGGTEDKSISVSYQPFPLGSWKYDAFQSWIAQKGTTTAISLLGQTLGTGLSLATGNPLGAVGGIAGIAGSIAQVYEQSLIPDGIKGSPSNNNVWYALGKTLSPIGRRLQIHPEYARIIDEYFTRYGYKVNRVKVPNIKTRSNFNYVKTIDAIVRGKAPAYATEFMRGLMDRGVTFWHTSNIGG